MKPKKVYRKYSPELTKELCAHLEAGLPITTACRLVGLTTMTYYTWVKEKPEFKAAVNAARAKAKIKLVAQIQKEAMRDWRAAAWILANSFREEYAGSL